MSSPGTTGETGEDGRFFAKGPGTAGVEPGTYKGPFNKTGPVHGGSDLVPSPSCTLTPPLISFVTGDPTFGPGGRVGVKECGGDVSPGYLRLLLREGLVGLLSPLPGTSLGEDEGL